MKILVPFDFSKTSEMAIFHAMYHQNKLGGTITILHVLPSALITPSEIPIIIDTLENRDEIKSAIEARIIECAKLYAIDPKFTEVIVEAGDTASCILSLEENEKFDLIVMGTHDKESLFDRFLGSISTSVTLQSKSPILLVHSTSQMPHKLSKILFAIDDITDLKGSLDLFLNYNELHNANTNFIHFTDTKDKIESQVDDVLRKFYLENSVKFTFQIDYAETNKPMELLEKTIEEGEYELLVVVRNNSTIFDRYFRKSFSSSAVHKTFIPTLVYKSKGKLQ
jgi:nucleotide-binding universal stress UspA family protein